MKMPPLSATATWEFAQECRLRQCNKLLMVAGDGTQRKWSFVAGTGNSRFEVCVRWHYLYRRCSYVSDDPTKYSTFLKTRPEHMEIDAIKKIIDLASNNNVKIHIVHLSSAKALPLIKKAKESGMKLTVETCYHYLSLNSENIPDKMTQFKCCPPIRNNDNKEKLWTAVKNNIIDQIVSDHSPCTPDLKCLDEGNFLKAWGGISSLQFGLSLFWTEAKKRGFEIWDVSKFLSCNPAKLCGFHTQKGEIKKGMDADFVVWNPDEQYEITTEIIFHKNKLTPYLGKWVCGKVVQTIVRGETVFQNGVHLNPTGQLLKK